MSPKRPTFSLAELPGALYEHMILTMDGSWNTRFRAMFALECTAKACRIPLSVWHELVLACLKEIKDVNWERLLMLDRSDVQVYKRLAEYHEDKVSFETFRQIVKCIMRDDLSDLLLMLTFYPQALTQKRWYDEQRLTQDCFFVMHDAAVPIFYGAIVECYVMLLNTSNWLVTHPQTDPVHVVDLVEFLDAITEGATPINYTDRPIPEGWSGKIAAHFHKCLQ